MPTQFLPNLVLRRRMEEYGLTHDDLAEAVNDELGGSDADHAGRCTDRQVRRWLSGETAWPRPPGRRALEKVFGRPAAELGFRPPAGSQARATVHKPPSAPDQETPVHRRQFVVGLTGAMLVLPHLPEAGRLGMSDIDRIQEATTRLHQLDDRHGGDQVADIAARYVEYVESAARRCTFGSAVQSRLYRALGEMATSTGWFAFDAGRHEAARRWWDAGLRHAYLAGDTALQTRIMSSLSHQAYELGHGSEAVAIARVALDKTRGRRDGQLSALLHTRVAQGLAIDGEPGRCGRSLARAEQAFDRTTADFPRWLGFFGPGELGSAAALCHYDLGQYTRAVEEARASLHDVEATPFRRNELAARARLGRCLVAAGEAEEAVAMADGTLALLPSVRSNRIGQRVRRLRDDLLDRGLAGAADFSERYEAVVTCP